jgi:hypothetical protein
MIIAIDFDGTIVRDRFPDIGEMMPAAKEVINRLYADGHRIIIWTSRTGVELARAVEWLAKNEIRYHLVNESCPDNTKKYGGRDTRKIYADVYVDDRGLVPLPDDWHEIKEMIIDKMK